MAHAANGEARVIVGLGVDVAEVTRIARALGEHGERFISRCFAAGEVRRPNDAAHIAGLFAAKEAAFKALGTGWGEGVGWRDVTLDVTPAGAPVLAFFGAAAARARVLGARRTHVSITHAAGVAIAVVILDA